MRLQATSACRLAWFWAALAGLLTYALPGVAAEPALKLEALLVWGTNDPRPPDPKLKPVTPEVRKKLEELPFKWTTYFVVNRVLMDVPPKDPVKAPVSEKCEIQVKNLGNTTVEVSLYGKREHVLKRTQRLPKGETLVLGGNAPNATSWFVILRQTEAAAAPQPQPAK